MVDLGKTFAMFGEDDKAKMAFNHVLKVDPSNEEATKNLQYLG
jgi:Flp pilus assembly protein TadD